MSAPARSIAELAGLQRRSDVLTEPTAVKPPPPPPEPKRPVGRPRSGGKAVQTSGGVEFVGVEVDQRIPEDSTASDWAHVFRAFGLDETEFEIVGDTVTMTISGGEWEQSKRLESGDRDTVKLHSTKFTYSARFVRKPKGRLPDAVIADHIGRLRKHKLPRRIPGCGLGAPSAVLVNLADIQGGKSEGGGVKATEDRLLSGLENVQRYINRQRKFGANLSEIVIANNGDPIEGCAGNYASQLFTVEMNLASQMDWALEMWETYARALFPQFDRAQFVSVLCNHGEFGRMGSGKNQTSASDNAGRFLAQTLRRVLAGRREFEHVTWTIPHDEMTVYPTIAGVPTAFNHGHTVPGSDAKGFEKWLNGQVRGDAQAHAARIWITAHRHHFAQWDMGSQWVFQCPSLDGGSKWLRDMNGSWSRSGILAMMVGEHDPLGFSDVAFL